MSEKSTFDEVLLPADQQSDLIEVVRRRRLAERGRCRVVADVREGVAEFQSGDATLAGADELIREITS